MRFGCMGDICVVIVFPLHSLLQNISYLFFRALYT